MRDRLEYADRDYSAPTPWLPFMMMSHTTDNVFDWVFRNVAGPAVSAVYWLWNLSRLSKVFVLAVVFLVIGVLFG